jgi:aspartyl-tRNA(Asn)/glutamyl-tRNA(Gln) amidotransferase subunit B
MFPFDGVDRVCRITRLHVENDAGKLIHRMGQTLCDFNRAGTPLIEIVTEPDLRSPGEARAFAEELRRLLVAVGASSADMYKGMMRFDASISIRYKGEERLTPRAEIKNLNSFDALFLALSYEERRLREEWVKQGPPRSQITVGWEAETGKTEVLREKEEAADYRYFPEPDIPPLELSEQLLEELRRNLSILPQQVRKKYKNVGLSESETAMLIDQPYYQPVFDFVLERTGDISRAKSLVLTQLAGFINADDDRGCPGSARMCELLGGLLDLTEWGRIHRNQEKEILAAMVRTNRTADQVVYEEGVRRAETSEVERCIQTAIRENPRAIEDYRKGKEKALSAVVGWVMKETRGRADPRRVRDMLVEELQIETKRTK